MIHGVLVCMSMFYLFCFAYPIPECRGRACCLAILILTQFSCSLKLRKLGHVSSFIHATAAKFVVLERVNNVSFARYVTVPVAPLQKPDEMNIPNQSWMHAASEGEDINLEQAIPTMITWTYGGKEVAVEGSWDDWKTRKPLQGSAKEFSIMKVLPSGVYRYTFIVDGKRRYSPELPWGQDESGNYYNILDLQEYVPDDIESISGFEPPLSPDSSYNNMELNTEDFAKEPPLVPPHLQLTLLNAPSSSMEISPPMSRPPHVVLNHLYMQKGKSGPSVVALGSTHRFLSKYVTVVLYKSFRDT